MPRRKDDGTNESGEQGDDIPSGGAANFLPAEPSLPAARAAAQDCMRGLAERDAAFERFVSDLLLAKGALEPPPS